MTGACVFCDQPAVTEVEITPALYYYPKGKKTLKQLPVMARVCACHAEATERDRGWQQRQAVVREAQRQALKDATAAAPLFDPAATTPRRSRARTARSKTQGGGRRG